MSDLNGDTGVPFFCLIVIFYGNEKQNAQAKDLGVGVPDVII